MTVIFIFLPMKFITKGENNVFMQRELYKAVKVFGGFISLYFYREYIDGNNPLLLTQNLGYIMGDIVGGWFSYTPMMDFYEKATMSVYWL